MLLLLLRPSSCTKKSLVAMIPMYSSCVPGEDAEIVSNPTPFVAAPAERITRSPTAITLLSLREPTVVLEVTDSEESVAVFNPIRLSGGDGSMSIAYTMNTSLSSTFSCRSTLSSTNVLGAVSDALNPIVMSPDVSFKPFGMVLAYSPGL